MMNVDQLRLILIASGEFDPAEIETMIENTDFSFENDPTLPDSDDPHLTVRERKRLKALHDTNYSDSMIRDSHLIARHCEIIDGVIKVKNPEFW
jgi:hypothetical protein